MDKVLVVKAIEPNYNTLSGGPPIMMVGGGGRRGDQPVGRTLRERAGGLGGGLVGVLGALAGRHRSLGGLVQAMISGGAQGKALGGALGRKFVGRAGQRRADLREGRRQQRAQSDAEMAEDVRSRGRGMGSRFNPAAKFRRDNQEVRDREDRLLDRTNLANRSTEAARRQASDYTSGRVAVARNRREQVAHDEERARAKRSGAEQGDEDRLFAEQYRKLRESLVAMGVPEQEVEERMNAFNQKAKSQGYRVDPQPTSSNPTQGGNAGNVQVVDATGTHQGNAQQMTTPLALQQGAPLGNANTEIKAIEDAGDAEAMQNGTDHERRSTVKVVNPNEDEDEEQSLGRMASSDEQAFQRRRGLDPLQGFFDTVTGDTVQPSLEQLQREKFEREQQGGN